MENRDKVAVEVAELAKALKGLGRDEKEELISAAKEMQKSQKGKV